MAYPRSSVHRTFSSVKVKSGYVQRRPFVNPLPYSSYGGVDQRTDSAYPLNPITNPYSLGVIQGGDVNSSIEVRLASSAAYDRIISRVKGQSTASVATSVMERRESFNMIAKRATQLRLAYSSLRRGDVAGMMTQFGFKRRQTRKKTHWVRQGKKGFQYRLPVEKTKLDEIALKRGSKKVGNLWLEYWFGWAPLVNDVYSTVKVLENPLPPEALRNVFRGTGHSTKSYNYRYQTSKMMTTDAYQAAFLASYTARVRSKSPNLALANRLGLVNPAATAYELLPFSWLVDWFLPVGRFIESYTDTVGFSVDRVVASQKRTVNRSYYSWIKNGQPSGWGDRVSTNQSNSFMSSRNLLGSLPVPGLFDRRGSALSSMTRAATAVSLLTGYFKTRR